MNSWRSRILGFFGQSSGHVESNAPKGWYLRGFVIALLIAFPVALWLVGHHRGSSSQAGWTLSVCPPVASIPLAELSQHPMRFRNKFIWIAGRVRIQAKHCVTMPCAKGKRCCHPCRARLVMGESPHQIILTGALSDQPNPLVGCRGTSCGMNCLPFVPPHVYAVAGKAMLTSDTNDTDGTRRRRFSRPRYRVRSFRIHRFCRMPLSATLRERRRLREPLHKARK